MSATACTFLRHDVRPRFIGDLVAAYCHTCGCLWLPEPVVAPAVPRVDPRPVPGATVEGWTPGELVAAWGK